MNIILKTRVPDVRKPVPTSSRVVASCGNAGALVENTYEGQKFPWGLYQQNDHGVSIVVIVEAPDDCYIALVEQWRPTDANSIELPAGGLGQGGALLEELEQEVGRLDIISVKMVEEGLSHDPARKTMKDGGPMCFFPVIVHAKSLTPPKEYVDSEGDERTHSRFYRAQEVREMVQNGRIADLTSVAVLMMARIVEPQDILFRSVPVDQFATTNAS